MVGMRKMEELIANARPDFGDAEVAAAMLHFIDTRPPSTYETSDGVVHENVEMKSARELADERTLEYIKELERRAGKMVYVPKRH